MSEELKEYIREVPDFPKPGINFYDITTLLQHPIGFRRTIEAFQRRYQDRVVDKVVGIDARGFIFGAALAFALGVGFVPVRKKGKLPARTRQATYALEYGTDVVELHEDALSAGEKVILIDDLLATGGTMAAAVELVGHSRARIIECAFAVELTALCGRDRIEGPPVFSLIQYEQ